MTDKGTEKTEWQKRGKEASPEATIERIRNILTSQGFQFSMQELPQSLDDCYSCRLTIDNVAGGFIGTNGKGMTKELSNASAYGEMMERLSNRIFSTVPRFDDEEYADFRSRNTPLAGLYDENEPPCITNLVQRFASTVKSPSPFLSDESIVRSFIEKLAPRYNNGKFNTLDFYSVREDKYYYLPEWLFLFISSNGMAAGNSYEEATIECLSEILERFVQLKIFDGGIVPPEIPREEIARFGHIMKVIDEIESKGDYRVRILDCSLGLQLPVVCGVIINLKTGKFGCKFGAQPNMAIALERIFTEALQGSALEEFTNRSSADYSTDKHLRRTDKWNSVKVASVSMPCELLQDNASYEFTPWKSTDGKNNKEILKELIDLVLTIGNDVFIHNSSYLGFPAVCIYVPEVSEVKPIDFLEIKMTVLQYKVQGYFRRINSLTDDEVEDICVLASSKRGAVIENTINSFSLLCFTEPMPGTPFEADFLYALCLYRLGKLKEAAKVFGFIAGGLKQIESSPEKVLFYEALHQYVLGLSEGMTEDNIYCVISHLFPTVCEAVRSHLRDPKTVLEKFYPVCEGKPLNEITAGGCVYNQLHDFYKKLIDAENNNPLDPDIIRNMIRN